MKVEAQESIIHGTGLFAIKDIAEGEAFLEYTGRYMNEEELWQQFHDDYGDNYEPGGLHVWAFEVRKNLYIDGDHPDNIAKYANHSCEGNCEAVMDEDRVRKMSPGLRVGCLQQRKELGQTIGRAEHFEQLVGIGHPFSAQMMGCPS